MQYCMNMDILCKAVKENEGWDFESQECKDIAEAVDLILSRFVGFMHEDYPKLTVSHLFRGGSMEEKTRLLRNHENKIEFDYLAVISHWPDIGPLRFKHSCPGCMNIEYDVGDQDSGSGDKRNLSVDCSYTMLARMIKCVDKRCELNFCSQDPSGNRSICNGCSACTVYLTTGCLVFSGGGTGLGFQWNPKVPMTTDDYKNNFGKNFIHTTSKRCSFLPNPLVDYRALGKVNVIVDFHPAFELHRENIIYDEDGQPPTEIPSDMTSTLYLFPKGTKCCCGFNNHTFCWRISTITQELQMIKSTTPEHRYAYMTLKFLTFTLLKCTELLTFETNYWGGSVKPYVIKTLFLHHVDKCREPGRDMKECVTDMLTNLVQFVKTGDIAHFHLKYSLDPSMKRSRTLDPEMNFPQLHCFLTYLKAILTCSMHGVHSDFDDIAIDMISLSIIHRGYIIHDKKSVPAFYKTLESKMEKFIKTRYTFAAEEALKMTAFEYHQIPESRRICKLHEDLAPITQRIMEYLKNIKASERGTNY